MKQWERDLSDSREVMRQKRGESVGSWDDSGGRHSECRPTRDIGKKNWKTTIRGVAGLDTTLIDTEIRVRDKERKS